MDSIASGMNNLPTQSDRCAQVVPTGNLTNGKNIAVVQTGVVGGVGVERIRERDLTLLAFYLLVVDQHVVGQIGGAGVGALLQTSRGANQIGDSHVGRQRISAGPIHYSLDVD